MHRNRKDVSVQVHPRTFCVYEIWTHWIAHERWIRLGPILVYGFVFHSSQPDPSGLSQEEIEKWFSHYWFLATYNWRHVAFILEVMFWTFKADCDLHEFIQFPFKSSIQASDNCHVRSFICATDTVWYQRFASPEFPSKQLHPSISSSRVLRERIITLFSFFMPYKIWDKPR